MGEDLKLNPINQNLSSQSMQFLKCVFIKLFSQVSAVKEQRTFSTAGLEVRFCVALPPTVP